MEVELLGEEVGFFNMWVKKSNGGGAQVVLRSQVVSWLLGFLEWEPVGLVGLIELVGGLWIDDLVVEFEVCVFEVSLDGLIGLKIDWSSPDHAWILVEIKAFSWSHVDRVLVGL